jgi:DNA modification methylase
MINLIQGDCLEKMKDLKDGSIDLILTDPPYGTTACKWDSAVPLEPMWEQLKRVIKPNGAIVLFGSQPFTTVLIASNLKMYKYSWVWDKVKPASGLIAKVQPLRVTEDIVVFSGVGSVYLPQMKEKALRVEYKNDSNGEAFGGKKVHRLHDNKGLGYPKNLITFSNASQQDRVHPTQKPVPLMEYLIKTYTNEGEVVLDFTMGSGTTGVACVNTNRSFIGIERDEKYFAIAKDRIEKQVKEVQG